MENKRVIDLGNGVIAEVSGNRYKIISATGDVTLLNKKGNLIETKYFFKMGEDEREVIKTWRENIGKIDSPEVRNFIGIVDKALEIVDYNYYIATIEPSIKKGKIFYEPGNSVKSDLTCAEWAIKAKQYAPGFGSRLADIYELFLWYAYRIAMRYWSLRYVCWTSASKGNYNDSLTRCSTNDNDLRRDLSGRQKVGGFSDGVGNTYKITKTGNTFCISGGSFCDSGWRYPVASTSEVIKERIGEDVGVVVLSKVD